MPLGSTHLTWNYLEVPTLQGVLLNREAIMVEQATMMVNAATVEGDTEE
jgi:hypothetical protein